MMEKFLGFDCASRSLAWSYIEINFKYVDEIKTIIEKVQQVLDRASPVVNSDDLLLTLRKVKRLVEDALNVKFIKLIDVNAVDTLSGGRVKDTSPVTRAKALWELLEGSNVAANKIESPHVLIESQPCRLGQAANTVSTAVEHQLLIYYIREKIDLVHPSLKNTIALGDKLQFSEYLENARKKYKQGFRYKARKAHARDNILKLLTIFDLIGEISHIPKKFYPDFADSLAEILAWCVKNGMFTTKP